MPDVGGLPDGQNIDPFKEEKFPAQQKSQKQGRVKQTAPSVSEKIKSLKPSMDKDSQAISSPKKISAKPEGMTAISKTKEEIKRTLMTISKESEKEMREMAEMAIKQNPKQREKIEELLDTYMKFNQFALSDSMDAVNREIDENVQHYTTRINSLPMHDPKFDKQRNELRNELISVINKSYERETMLANRKREVMVEDFESEMKKVKLAAKDTISHEKEYKATQKGPSAEPTKKGYKPTLKDIFNEEKKRLDDF